MLEGIDMHSPGTVAVFADGGMSGVPLKDMAGFVLLSGRPRD